MPGGISTSLYKPKFSKNEQVILNNGGDNFTASGNIIIGGVEGVHYALGGIQSRSGDNSVISNNNVSYAKFGIQVGGTSITKSVTVGEISRNNIHDLGINQSSYVAGDWQGIELTGDAFSVISGVSIKRNNVIDIAGAGIGLYYASSNFVDNNIVVNTATTKLVFNAL